MHKWMLKEIGTEMDVYECHVSTDKKNMVNVKSNPAVDSSKSWIYFKLKPLETLLNASKINHTCDGATSLSKDCIIVNKRLICEIAKFNANTLYAL
jgi:hypothetical protein